MIRRLALVGLACVVGCFEHGTAADTRRDILASWGESIIVAGYHRFAEGAKALDAATTAFCAAPDAAGLAQVRAAWQSARGRWKRMEVFAFGPYTAYPDRLGSTIDFWPAREAVINAVLDADGPLDAATLEVAGAAARGLPAIEALLYAERDATLDAFAEMPRRCAYLRAAAADLAGLADAMHAAWAPGAGDFVTALTEPRAGGSYADVQAAFGEIINRMGFALEDIRTAKLGRPLGDEIGSPQPDRAESRFSGRSLDDIGDVLDGIEDLIDGANGGLGLTAHPKVIAHPELVESLHRALAEARAALAAVPPPLTDAVVTAPETVRAAIDALGQLQRGVQVDLVSALALSLAFNDADGD
ncbi:MAG: imelysin family protein [Myxococcales bacterium]|nr:imelysin family protein [Myxococcales bacterium]